MDSKLFHCASCIIFRKFSPGVHNQTILVRGFSLSGECYKQKKKSHYEVLGLHPKATPNEIRAAFITLSKEIHPDMNPQDPSNHAKFVQLNEAYTILAKPSSRREYDLSLAHRVYYDDYLKRHGGYHAYTAGNMYTPGSGTARNQSFEFQQRPFWDETIYHMRDKSRDRDAFYEDDRYYGIKGIKRQSNSVILMICLGFMAIGSTGFFLCLKYSAKKRREHFDVVSRQNYDIYNKTRENALKYTTAEQLHNLLVAHNSNPGLEIPTRSPEEVKK